MAIVRIGRSYYGLTFKNCVPERIFKFEKVCVKAIENVQGSLKCVHILSWCACANPK